jgi:hypothetical protein
VNSRIFHQDSKNEHHDIVEGSAPFKTKEETTNNKLEAMDVGALTILGTVALTDQKDENDDKPGLARILSGSRSQRTALRKEQLERKHHAN